MGIEKAAITGSPAFAGDDTNCVAHALRKLALN